MHNKQSEVAKDFKGAITKLIKYDKTLIRLLILSLIMSFASSALAIIGPDKLKDITNMMESRMILLHRLQIIEH